MPHRHTVRRPGTCGRPRREERHARAVERLGAAAERGSTFQGLEPEFGSGAGLERSGWGRAQAGWGDPGAGAGWGRIWGQKCEKMTWEVEFLLFIRGNWNMGDLLELILGTHVQSLGDLRVYIVSPWR